MSGFEQDLVRVRGDELERGDAVFERVQFGLSPADSKFKKWKVMGTDRETAHVVCPDGGPGRPKKIRFSSLYREKNHKDAPVIEKKPFNAPRLVTAPANGNGQASAPPARKPDPPQPSTIANVDSELDAWLDQGQGLLREAERRETQVEEEILAIDLDLEKIDNRYRPLIEKAEAEAESLKRDHADDRALAESRREALARKLTNAADRKKSIEKMLEKAGG